VTLRSHRSQGAGVPGVGVVAAPVGRSFGGRIHVGPRSSLTGSSRGPGSGPGRPISSCPWGLSSSSLTSRPLPPLSLSPPPSPPPLEPPSSRRTSPPRTLPRHSAADRVDPRQSLQHGEDRRTRIRWEPPRPFVRRPSKSRSRILGRAVRGQGPRPFPWERAARGIPPPWGEERESRRRAQVSSSSGLTERAALLCKQGPRPERAHRQGPDT
jgi:hypothetical protein